MYRLTGGHNTVNTKEIIDFTIGADYRLNYSGVTTIFMSGYGKFPDGTLNWPTSQTMIAINDYSIDVSGTYVGTLIKNLFINTKHTDLFETVY